MCGRARPRPPASCLKIVSVRAYSGLIAPKRKWGAKALADSASISDVVLTGDLGEECAEIKQPPDGVRAERDAGVARTVALIYDELRQAAAQLMNAEHDGHTLQPTALVHEVFLKLGDSDVFHGQDRPRMIRVAVHAMRRLLVDSARRRNAQRRGGNMRRHWLDEFVSCCDEQHLDIAALGEALDELADVHERACQVTTLRFFGGFPVREVAHQLNVSVSTVEADFRFARAWLRSWMSERVYA